MPERITELTVCALCGVEVSLSDNLAEAWIDDDGTPVCSLGSQTPHEPVTLYAIPSADELGEAMYAIAASGARRGQGDDRRFRNSIKGWAKLAHQVLTGGQR